MPVLIAYSFMEGVWISGWFYYSKSICKLISSHIDFLCMKSSSKDVCTHKCSCGASGSRTRELKAIQGNKITSHRQSMTVYLQDKQSTYRLEHVDDVAEQKYFIDIQPVQKLWNFLQWQMNWNLFWYWELFQRCTVAHQYQIDEVPVAGVLCSLLASFGKTTNIGIILPPGILQWNHRCCQLTFMFPVP